MVNDMIEYSRVEQPFVRSRGEFAEELGHRSCLERGTGELHNEINVKSSLLLCDTYHVAESTTREIHRSFRDLECTTDRSHAVGTD